MSQRLPRKERERLRNRRLILDVALDLFSKRGYHNVSMHEIAEMAEFATGTLYNFFKSKEDLYREMLFDFSKKMADSVTAALKSADDEIEKLENFIKAKSEKIMKNERLVQLFLSLGRGMPNNTGSNLNEEIIQIHRKVMALIAEIFEQGIRKKRFRNLDPTCLAEAFDSLSNTALLMSLRNPNKHPYDKTVETMKLIFFDPVLID